MKIFLDSADLKEIEAASQTGLIDGVTTNPSLVAKASKMPFEELLKKITQWVPGPVSAEVISTAHDGMMEEAMRYSKISPYIVIKLPLTFAGLKSAKTCAERGIQTNVTLCFSATQALLAAKAQATYISPFIGRLDDIGQEGMKLIEEIMSVYKAYDFKTQVLVASIRHVEHVLRAAMLGAHVATIPYKVFTQLIAHPLTDSGLAKFLEDWKKSSL